MKRKMILGLIISLLMLTVLPTVAFATPEMQEEDMNFINNEEYLLPIQEITERGELPLSLDCGMVEDSISDLVPDGDMNTGIMQEDVIPISLADDIGELVMTDCIVGDILPVLTVEEVPPITLPSNDTKGVRVAVDGFLIGFKVNPYIEDGVTYAPIRTISERLGLDVLWDKKEGKVFIEGMRTKLELQIGNNTILVHRKDDFSGIPQEIKLKEVISVIDGKTIAPVRLVCELLDTIIEYNKASNTVVIRGVGESSEVEKTHGITYEKITKDSLNDEVLTWYEDKKEEKGTHYFELENSIVVLVSAGLKSTGGYGVDVDEVTLLTPTVIGIDITLTEPSLYSIVSQAFTNPHQLIEIPTKDLEIEDVVGDMKTVRLKDF